MVAMSGGVDSSVAAARCLQAGHDVIDVVHKHKVDSIVHLAVPGLNALSPAADYQTNMNGLLNILEAGRIAGRLSTACPLPTNCTASRADAGVRVQTSWTTNALSRANRRASVRPRRPQPTMLSVRPGTAQPRFSNRRK